MGIFKKNKNTASADERDARGSGNLQDRQRKNFITTFSLLAKLARADGRVSKAEIDVINDLIDNRLKLDENKKSYAIKIFNEARNSPISFMDYALEFKAINEDQPKLCEWLFELLMSVAFADEVISENESEILGQLQSVFGISDETFSRIKGQYSSDVEKALAMLNCTSRDTIEQVEKKYQELISEYDPANLKSKGLPEEFIALAQQKLTKLSEAYHQVMKCRR